MHPLEVHPHDMSTCARPLNEAASSSSTHHHKGGQVAAAAATASNSDDDDDAVGPNPSQANKVITLQYDWAEVVEHDVEAGLVTLFSLTLMVFLVIMCRFCATMDDPETATPAAKRR